MNFFTQFYEFVFISYPVLRYSVLKHREIAKRCLENISLVAKVLSCYYQKLFGIFHQLGPLGRVGQRVDMSVCVFLCPLPMQFFFRPLIGPQVTWSDPCLSLALRSHDQIPASYWSTPPCLVRGLVRYWSRSRSQVEP